MTIAILLVLAMAASLMLMMRFRKRTLAKINLVFTNRITSRFAGRAPGFGILTYVGRKSGRVYRTPVNVFPHNNGFAIALTYGRESEWLKNVLAAGGCELQTRSKVYRLSAPEIVHDPGRRPFPFPARLILAMVGAEDFMQLTIARVESTA